MSIIHVFTSEELQKMRRSMVGEFSDAAAGKKTSLAFARHHLKNRASKEIRAQVLVIGGTNCVTAQASRQEGHVTIDEIHDEPLPDFDTAETFLAYVESHVRPDTSLLGLNFAYPLAPRIRDGRLDGLLLRPTKEHTFEGVTGREVGRLVEEHLLAARGQEVRVSTANDTVCLILSGLEKYESTGLAGGVIGTGFNFGFFLDGETLVNLESGNFDKFSTTDSCRVIDQNLENRGCQLWEKEISGAYLFRHYNYHAEKEGLSSANLVSTEELSTLAETGSGASRDLAREILQRSASLAAAQIAAIHDYLDVETLNVLIEGSLFWKAWHYRHTVEATLADMGLSGPAVNIDHIPQSHIMGGALLALGS